MTFGESASSGAGIELNGTRRLRGGAEAGRMSMIVGDRRGRR